MKTIKTWLTTIAVLLCSGMVNAYDFEVDGIYYNVLKTSELEVSVTSSTNGYVGDIVIPETVTFENFTYMVTSIDGAAFRNSTITSISLPQTITSIGNEAFVNCSKLVSVIIPPKVTSIGFGSFRSCSSLQSVIIQGSVDYIYGGAFRYCSELRDVFFIGDYYPNISKTTSGGNGVYTSHGLAFEDNHFSRKIYVKNKTRVLATSRWDEYSDAIVEYVTIDRNEFTYNGQTPSVSYTNNLDNKYEVSMDMSSLQKDAGTYETTFKAAYSNGVEVEIPYTYTINKVPLTINVNDAEKIYGDKNPAFTYSLTGFVNNEDESVLSSAVAFSTKATAKSGVGTYSVAASATAKNYEIGCTEGTLTVKKAPLSVKVNAKSRVYGDSNPQFDFTYVGLKNGDGVPVFTSEITTSTKATKYSDAGDYEVTVSGGVATNYSFTEYIPGILTITPAPLNISVQSTVREYGDANPEFQFAYSGFKNDDDADCLTTPPIVVTSATPTSSVGEYEITPNGAEATNYVISYTNGTLTVNKAPLTIQVENAERVYGDENPKFTFAYSGFKNEETYDVLSERPSAKTEAITTSGVGTYNIVPSGAEAQNYDITYKNGTLTVTKAPLSVSAVSNTKEYGETNPKVALTYSGFKNNDNEDCISERPTVAIAADRLSDVGEYAITVSGGKAQNYEFTEYNEGILTVEKAPLNVIADDKERLYFEANPEFTFHCEGFKNEDTKSVITTEPSFECSAKQTSSVGEYDITLSGAEAKNYELSYQGATLTIGKQTIDVKVGNYTRIYNEENPQFEMSYSGFVNNENEKVFTVMPTIQCEADKTTDVGAYEIIASGGEAVNYDFNYTSGTLTIEKAAQEIVWEQDLTTIAIGDQVELTAIATSGLAIEYELAANNIVSIYEAAGKIYLDCFGVGEVMIKAIQQGNKNYHSAVRVSKKLVVTDPSGVESVITNSEDAPIYNLQGERMIGSRKELQKGIYIQNGRKFVVK
ncbi:MAG: leucine-rich repeat protein [Bacteroidaceae bacterium]|nr:leucine-rich repeat protein [Bacteroidaceae bacterium]